MPSPPPGSCSAGRSTTRGSTCCSLEGAWCVGELEAIEPGLYLDVLPATAEPFADLVVDRLKAIRAFGRR